MQINNRDSNLMKIVLKILNSCCLLYSSDQLMCEWQHWNSEEHLRWVIACTLGWSKVSPRTNNKTNYDVWMFEHLAYRHTLIFVKGFRSCNVVIYKSADLGVLNIFFILYVLIVVGNNNNTLILLRGNQQPLYLVKMFNFAKCPC